MSGKSYGAVEDPKDKKLAQKLRFKLKDIHRNPAPEESIDWFKWILYVFSVIALALVVFFGYVYAQSNLHNTDDGSTVDIVVASKDDDTISVIVDIDTLKPSPKPSSLPTLDPTKRIYTTKPNIVFILADDLGWNSLGYTDEDMAFVTPKITALAKDGMILDNFYAQEVCSPSRGSLLTGRYPLSIGMQYGMVAATADWGMPLEETTLANVLQDEGYATHMLGKWHLGYFTPLLLPTARGFDSYIGYVNGENYYWSKRSPDYPEFEDFITADKDCYVPYNDSDKHDYSTTFYTNHALEIIEQHDQDTSLFLYIAYQAVHDPFVDIGKYRKGMPDEYLPENVLNKIHSNVVGMQRREYMKSLYMLDDAVGQIYDKLEETDMLDNTYIIFMSDNGGCFYGGGKNGPLRGSKGSLFEGGIKVDSFIYSPLLSTSQQGSTYSNLMHVSDWFPTILSLLDISYTPEDSDYSLDGVDHTAAWSGGESPRTTMLYNLYLYLTDYNFNIWYNGSFAVRNERYKLLHTYNDSKYGAWYSPEMELSTDDEITNPDDNRCAQQFLSGQFTYFLFDLDSDPYEYTNLYDSDDADIVAAKEELYGMLPGYETKATTKIGIEWSMKAMKKWQALGNNILPWVNTLQMKNHGDFPDYCGDLSYP